MLQVHSRAPDFVEGHEERLTLPFDSRQKSRQLAKLDSGEEVALLLPRGTILRGGDRLLGNDGRVVVVVAASERLSCARSEDQRHLARAAYHLGNRHVALQIEPDRVLYQHDHVLDHMLRELGLTVSAGSEPFEPEAGAYSHSSSVHAHTHSHDGHAHTHSGAEEHDEGSGPVRIH